MLTLKRLKKEGNYLPRLALALALAAPLSAEEPFVFGGGNALTALSDAQLQTIRGGYYNSLRNIDISVALATETQINGEVVSNNQLLAMQISNGQIYNSSASASLMNLIQIGQGNIVADGLNDAFITIIQNNLDDQYIQHRTFIDIEANVLDAIEAANLDRQLQQQLIDSIAN